MSKEIKFFIGIGVVTLIIAVVGSFFLGGQSQNTVSNPSTNLDLVSGAKHIEGTSSAKVKVVEFGDFQCPACGVAHPIVKQIVEKNKDKILFVFRNYPLPVHPNAIDAARAAEAAGEQGKYWEMHNMLYENQADWSNLASTSDRFNEYAQKLGLDVTKFDSDLAGEIAVINADSDLGNKAGVDATPTFFINGQKYSGVINDSDFQKIIDSASK